MTTLPSCCVLNFSGRGGVRLKSAANWAPPMPLADWSWTNTQSRPPSGPLQTCSQVLAPIDRVAIDERQVRGAAPGREFRTIQLVFGTRRLRARAIKMRPLFQPARSSRHNSASKLTLRRTARPALTREYLRPCHGYPVLANWRRNHPITLSE